MDKIPMTAGGLKQLEDELRLLKDVERPAVVTAIGIAREHGDLKENAEYHAARERQSFIEGRVLELEAIISHAEVIDPAKLSGDMVRFGATVLLIDEETEEEKIYQILGEHEAELSNGTISISSPLARTMIGRVLGDSIEVKAPGGSKYYEIVKVEYK